VTAWGCVVLTQGRRPAELAAAVGSLLAQRGVELDVAVVGNGWVPTGLPGGVHAVALAEDAGIPGGRNAGVPAVTGELLFFLDDDARIEDAGTLAALAARFAGHDRLGLVQLRVKATDGSRGPRDWVPRLRVGDPGHSSDVCAVWEGAVAIRRVVFDAVGGWPEPFRFAHEGVDLAWRVLGAGHRVRYLGDVAVLHPVYRAAPHDYSAYYGARNRVWLAYRHLPLPLAVLFVLTFVARTLPLLARSPRRLQAAARGYRDGLRRPWGPRRPLSAGTLWRMTRAGRPPVI
jgi:GT2 family glycosyltransferase